MSFRTLSLMTVLVSACAADVGEGRVEATVTDATPATEAAAPANAEARTLAVDPSRSKLGLIGAKVTAQHPIHFNEFSGNVTVEGSELTGVSFTAQIASVESDADRLTEHLKGEDFLYAEMYPTAEFASTSITPGSDAEGDWTHTVTGNFTIRGVTKQISFPAKVSVTDAGVEATTEFVIDRQDFGVAYPGRADDLIQDNVAMQIHFVAPAA